MIKLLAVALLGFTLVACDNNQTYSEPSHYDNTEVVESQQYQEDDGFGTEEFIAGAAVGYLASSVGNNNNRQIDNRTYVKPKPVSKYRATKPVTKKPVSLNKTKSKKVSLTKRPSKSVSKSSRRK